MKAWIKKRLKVGKNNGGHKINSSENGIRLNKPLNGLLISVIIKNLMPSYIFVIRLAFSQKKNYNLFVVINHDAQSLRLVNP